MSREIAIGICVGMDKAALVAPGYDYLELGVSPALIPLEDDASFAARAPALQQLRPSARAMNLFAPRELKLVGPEVNWERVKLYTQQAVRRAAALGVQVIVVGSGGSRAVPEGYSRALAWGQLVRFFSLCADCAAEQGITFAIEPLNRKECNILNSYTEAVQLARDVERKEVRVLADLYHFMLEDEPLEHITQDSDWLVHVHLADTGRRYPGSGSWPLDRLFAILRDVGYRGMASIECSWGEDFASETASALRFLRALSE